MSFSLILGLSLNSFFSSFLTVCGKDLLVNSLCIILAFRKQSSIVDNESGSFLFRYPGVISVGNEAFFLPRRVRLSIFGGSKSSGGANAFLSSLILRF